MANKSDYGMYRAWNQDVSVVSALSTGATGPLTLITARDANHTIFVQRILLSVTTDAAQTLTFQDTAGTPVVIGKSPASPALGIEVVADFGGKGMALTVGKNLSCVISAAGLGGQIDVEAYQRQTSTVSL